MKQRVTLVTGASSGIGEAIVSHLAESDYRVFAAGRDRARTSRLRDRYSNVETWIGDITSPDSCTGLIAACIAQFGRLGLLVNNAAIYRPSNAEETTDDLWLETVAVNLNAPFFLSRAAMPHLRETKGIAARLRKKGAFRYPSSSAVQRCRTCGKRKARS